MLTESEPPSVVLVKGGSRPVVRNSIVVDVRRTTELEAQVTDLQNQLSESTRAKLSFKSRIDILEKSLAETKNQVRVLIEKDELNNELIYELKNLLKKYFPFFFCKYTVKTIEN